MLKYWTFLSLSVIAGASFAKPCFLDQRSCLELKNHTPSLAQIECNGLESVSAAGNSQGSTQLDLGSDDGMGSPSPWTLQCTLSNGQLKTQFDFYNPYSGPLLEFTLLSEQHLELRINDKWNGSNTFYTFNW